MAHGADSCLCQMCAMTSSIWMNPKVKWITEYWVSTQSTTRQPPHILLYTVMQDVVFCPALYRNLKALKRTIQDISDRGADLGTHIYEFQWHHSMGGSSIRNLVPPMLTGLLLKNVKYHQNTYEAWAFEEFRRMGYISINTRNSCRWINATHGSSNKINSPKHYYPYKMEDIGWFRTAFCQLYSAHTKPRISFTGVVQAKCARTPQDTSEDCKPSKENNMFRHSCLGGRSRSSMMIEHYLKQVREDHKDDDVPTFAFLHDDDLHIEDITSLHQYDNDKAAVIFQMLENPEYCEIRWLFMCLIMAVNKKWQQPL